MQDIRRCLAYLAFEMAARFNAHQNAQEIVCDFVQKLKPGTTISLGHIKDKRNEDKLSAAASKHPEIFAAAMHVATTVFQLNDVICIRVGKAVRNTSHHPECIASLTVNWTDSNTKALQFCTQETAKVSFANVVGQERPKVHFMQFVQGVSSEDWHLRSHEGLTEEQAVQMASDAQSDPPSPTPRSSSSSSRLSTSGKAAMKMLNPCSSAQPNFFGINTVLDDTTDLEEAYTALTNDDANELPPQTVQPLSNSEV